MSLATKYAVMKRGSGSDPCSEHGEHGCEMCHGGKMMAEGGEVDGDLVDRVMKSRKGEPTADFEENDFDVTDENPAEEFSYTGANSGDEHGNESVDENDRDLINRIMRSRAKRDRMPRPA